MSRALPDYEPREPQIEMAERVAQALLDRHPLLLEAGTGTGKTLGYLVPALLSGQRVVISTGTRHLQEQLFQKDLPLLEKCLPVPFTAVRLKGIANYLCLRRYSEMMSAAAQRSPRLPGILPLGRPVDKNEEMLALIAQWRDETDSGDRAELQSLGDDSPVWLEVSATSETRLGSRCPYFERCFVTQARRAAQRAELIVINHHLLCADLAVRTAFPEARLLPPYDALICDEAHQLEEVATDYFGITVSGPRLHALLRDLRRGTSTTSQRGAVEHLAAQAEREAERLFSELRRRLCLQGQAGRGRSGEGGRLGLHAEHLTGEPAEAALSLDTALESLQGSIAKAEPAAPQARAEGGSQPTGVPDLSSSERGPRPMSEPQPISGPQPTSVPDLASSEEAPQPTSVPDLSSLVPQLLRRVQALRDDLATIVEGGQRPGGKQVFWVEVREPPLPREGRAAVFLHASPVDVASTLRQHLYADCPAVVMTSATLAPGGRFDFVRQRLGLDGADELRLPSPFDFARQALLYLPDDLPEPSEAGFLPAACERIAELLSLTGGRAFLLFTSHHRMHSAHRRLAPLLAQRHRVLCQGEAPKHLLLSRFKRAELETGAGAVLFATSSFWEGVDVVGEALQLVVIDKLPFAPPDDPILMARCRRLEEEGLDPFATYQVPRAALLLAQGFGRLIRHREDRGIVALLDKRAQEKGYGQRVLAGLPPSCPRTSSLKEVARRWREQASYMPPSRLASLPASLSPRSVPPPSSDDRSGTGAESTERSIEKGHASVLPTRWQ